MSFFQCTFIFAVGSTLGWFLELIYRSFICKKIINPGFLVGPCLPIYGFGLVSITYMYKLLIANNITNFWLTVFLMGLSMVLVEFIAGLIFLKTGDIKLWDYSNEWGNYKGIICPKFFLFWIALAIFYRLIIYNYLNTIIIWYINNIHLSFFLGIFYGVLIIDVLYSTKILLKIRSYAKENDIIVKYEELKLKLKKWSEDAKEKYSFLFPFKNLDKTINKNGINIIEFIKNKIKRN